MVGARRICEVELNDICDSFAYPNGRAGDFNDETSWLLEGLAFSCGLTTVNGLAAGSRAVGWIGSLFQTGRVATYMFYFVTGVLVILATFLL